jgi:hypothetical protein
VEGGLGRSGLFVVSSVCLKIEDLLSAKDPSLAACTGHSISALAALSQPSAYISERTPP